MNNADKIQDYIDGQLLGAELDSFETELVQNQQLKDLVELHRTVGQIIQKRESPEALALLANIKAAENSIRKQSGVISFKKFLPILAAACALVIFSVYYFNSGNDLYNLPTMRSEVVRGQDANMKYEDAVKAFNDKEYTNAESILTSLIQQDSSTLQYEYYLALAVFGQEKYKQSIEILKPIADGESVFVDESNYYLAIAYHEIGDKELALFTLDKVSKASILAERAKKLYKKWK